MTHKAAPQKLRASWDRLLASCVLAFISILASIYVFYDLYPFGHPITIFLGVIVIFTWIYLNIHKELLLSVNILPILIGILLFLGIFLYYLVGPNFPTETKEHGWLLPSNELSPPNHCKIEKGALVFDIGSNIASFAPSSFRVVLIQVDNTPLVAVERDGDKLPFDIDIYDETHEIVAKVDRGEFHLSSNKVFYAIRNDDRSRLTVYNNNNEEVLDITYRNPLYVTLTGILFSKEGSKINITRDMIYIPARVFSAESMCFTNSALTVSKQGVQIGSPAMVTR
jgi:hypothetical protein